MRFKRWMRITPYDDTTRKRAAFARKMRLEREKLPLFAAAIAETQPDVDDVMVRRAVAWIDDQQRRRDAHAKQVRSVPICSRRFAQCGMLRHIPLTRSIC